MAFNNGPKLVTQGLAFLVDAADPTSYPGSGTTWTDVVSRVTGSISGSVSYTSSFYGGFNFTGPTASVRFDGTNIANYGSGSFTVELAFRPAQIQGIHYLISKNSGSFPSWGVYLSGSGGSGKLFSEFRISSTVSCSVSSSTTFVTGSNYQVDVRMVPGGSGSGFYVDGVSIGGGFGNGGGSLTSTGSLLIGNIAPSSSQAFSGSIFTTKLYSINTLNQPVQNYNAIASRLSKAPLVNVAAPVFELLVVAGGGGGGFDNGGGGGAGGLQYFSNFLPPIGLSQIIVGNSGSASSNGQNSRFDSIISIGGASGGNANGGGGNGGSGGGAGAGWSAGPQIGGTGSLGQGNNGGNSVGTSPFSAGGGGGAGSIGLSGVGTKSGNGGSGSFISSFVSIGGSPAGWFAGGGGGGRSTISDIGIGGIGGGGNGGIVSQIGRTGSVNTGGGGGGGGDQSFPGGAGSSGIVAIRYNGTPIALGGEITQSGGFTYHVYRTVGTSSFTVF
jgi:hypothetical protein